MTQRFRTTCPQCASVFRLGSEQLEVASGWVQCGVCGAAFDAYPALIAETPEPVAEPAPTRPPTTVPEAVTAEPSAPAAPVIPPSEPEDVDLPSIILIDPDQTASEEPGPLPEIPPARPQPFVPPPPRVGAVEPSARIEYATQPGTRPARRRRPWLAATASVLLFLTLTAQSAYFLRDSLASRYPETRPALEQACAALGCSLSLPKNLAQLQIVGSDLQTEGAGQLRLNLTLGNRAGRAQAWPVIVLTLTDQRNQPLARRSFAPSEYLGDARLIAAGMPPLSEQPLSLALAVRDLAPMGFNLQLTY